MSQQDQPAGPVAISREDLYQQVWTTPISRLAQHYGLSGNELKKSVDGSLSPSARLLGQATYAVAVAVTFKSGSQNPPELQELTALASVECAWRTIEWSEDAFKQPSPIMLRTH